MPLAPHKPKKKSASAFAKIPRAEEAAIVTDELTRVSRELELRKRVREEALNRFYEQERQAEEDVLDVEAIEIDEDYFEELFEASYAKVFGAVPKLAALPSVQPEAS